MDYPQGSGKRPLWQWLVIYLVIGSFIYLAVYYLFFTKKSGTALYPSAATPTLAASNQSLIRATGSGFQPTTLTIKAGTTIVWKNESEVAITVNSDPHPTHTSFPMLNLGLINSGSSASLTLTIPSIYKYHNHLNSSQTGTIIVQ